MAVVATVPNHAKYMMMTKEIDLENDTLKIILMDNAFTFDKDTHATLANVTANQLATEYGYTQNDETLVGVSVVEDDTNDKGAFTCTDVTWSASGGSIGPTGGYCIYDDTTSDNSIIVYVDFGTDYTVADSSSLQIKDIAISII